MLKRVLAILHLRGKMDFRDSEDELKFRGDVRGWIVEATSDIPNLELLSGAERDTWSGIWQDRLSAGGWVGITWPKEFGGRGLESNYQAIFNEEAALCDAPYPLNGAGMMLAGPTILVHGTDEIKSKYLSNIMESREIWCQGFSEPGSGSDLASLSTSAVKVDGGWVVNGSKIWTSWAHHAQRCMLLARTGTPESRHRGITYFLAPMDKIIVRPLTMINGDSEFNEMFIDDLFISDADVLGEVNNGWEVAMTTLTFERNSMALNLWVWARQAIDALIEAAKERGGENDVSLYDEIGLLHSDAEAVRIGSLRTMSEIQSGGDPGPESSALKLLWTWTMQNATRLSVQFGESSGISLYQPSARHRVNRYLRARAHSIEGGSDEIQKSIIAERVLGLPRSR